MLEILQIPFMQRALIVGVILAFLLAVLGVFVVLRKMSFFADGIAHSSLAGVAIAILFAWNSLVVAVLVAVFFSVLIFFLEKRFKFSSDLAIGIIFTTGLSLGVILMSQTPGYQPELMSYLFGNILAIRSAEVWWILGFAVVILGFVFWKKKALTLFSLNSDLARVSGLKVDLLQLSLYVALSVAVVLSIKALGIILVSALLVIPVANARLLAKSFKSLLIWSIVISELIVMFGIVGSYYLDWPTAPTIVVVGAILFGILGIWKR